MRRPHPLSRRKNRPIQRRKPTAQRLERNDELSLYFRAWMLGDGQEVVGASHLIAPAGVNQDHEQVPRGSYVERLIRKGVLAVEDRDFKISLANVVVQRSPRLAEEQDQGLPVAQQVTD